MLGPSFKSKPFFVQENHVSFAQLFERTFRSGMSSAASEFPACTQVAVNVFSLQSAYPPDFTTWQRSSADADSFLRFRELYAAETLDTCYAVLGPAYLSALDQHLKVRDTFARLAGRFVLLQFHYPCPLKSSTFVEIEPSDCSIVQPVLFSGIEHVEVK